MSETENHIQWYMGEYKALEEGEVGDSTFDLRERQLRQFREWFGGGLADVTDDDIRDYIIDLSSDGYASTTISSRRWALSKFYRRMANEGRIETNPYEQVSWKDISVASASETQKQRESDDGKRIQPLSQKEVRQLAEHVPDPKIRNELLIKLLAQTGMRAGEVANVKLDKVGRERRIIEFPEGKKTGTRKVAYQPSLSFLMEQWIDSGHRDVYSSATNSKYLFVTRKSEKMDNRQVNRVVVNAAENAGLQETVYEDAAGKERLKVTAHQLRHTFAVQALKNDMNLRYLQSQLGHEKLGTTEEYLKYVEGEALNAHREKGPSFSD